MVRSISVLYFILLTSLLATIEGVAQGHLFADVKVNKRSAYVGEPIEVVVGVYTSTWFTKGVDLQNLKVDGAFSVYFRSVSITQNIKGKNYAGVQFIYNVFPYEDVPLEIPSLTIKVETPDEGDYKGKPQEVKTRPVSVSVKSIPKDIEFSDWLVTSSLNVGDRWSKNVQKVKVGDVLERSISRTAQGTIYQMIPEVEWDSVAGVSIYPGRADFDTKKTSVDIRGMRTDRCSYLFEKEGTVTIPEKVVYWWNPSHQRLYKRTLKARTFEVEPNPNLGMIASLRDSLAIENEQTEIEIEEQKPDYKSMAKNGILYLIGFVLIVILFKWVLIPCVKWMRAKHHAYENSEKKAFEEFLKAIKSGQREDIWNKAYVWKSKLGVAETSIDSLIHEYGSDNLLRLFRNFESENSGSSEAMIVEWKLLRKKIFEGRKKPVKKIDLWINP
ncbi:BatD family protein [Aureibacter tunicatorum]|uniref:Oxygen tolerance protein BatD n=1 Tax=Aureibacter tunicatorum TaxID=866807 RepID=A0AAE3XL71_9BACT|nr:BatD family protein [Aureibacter tunicatorum]MDR6238043.1 hypothetical protein [Aureibacter tunicatorum]BDD03076.1 hypothetical protein AUTU_05590 [Aureibacter tunicatorum]